jgi:hypothetical protein
MDPALWRRLSPATCLFGVVVVLLSAVITAQSRSAGKQGAAADLDASRTAGREVFRFETFGNEGFWTDAMRMPQGVLDAKLTPLQALGAGLLVDIDAVPASMRDALARS